MTMSWVDCEPPLMACVVSDREHSFTTLPTTKECMIAIPSAELAEKVIAIGNCSGRDVDKFASFGLRTAKAQRVAAPLIADCFANVECWAIDTRLVVVVASGASDREQVSLTERSTAVRALRFCKLRRKRSPSANSHYSTSAYATIRKVVAAWWRNRRHAF